MGASACAGACACHGEHISYLNCCDEFTREVANLPRPILLDDVPCWDVELLASPIGELNGVAGYHTSVLIGGTEYFYGLLGIVHSPTITSHKKKSKMLRIAMGTSAYSGADLVGALEEYFPPGHYDLLRKNCNAFSDCAIYFLCGQRLSWNFRSMDQIGMLADHFGLIQSISAGEYIPNPLAVDFDLEAVIYDIAAERLSRKTFRFW